MKTMNDFEIGVKSERDRILSLLRRELKESADNKDSLHTAYMSWIIAEIKESGKLNDDVEG